MIQREVHERLPHARGTVKLTALIRKNVTIDRTVRENVRANLRRLVKRLLRKYNTHPIYKGATQIVLKQANC